MSIVKCHESHYVGVLDNPHNLSQAAGAFKGGRGDISRCWVEISSDQDETLRVTECVRVDHRFNVFV